jgi:hypothetical protein
MLVRQHIMTQKHGPGQYSPLDEAVQMVMDSKITHAPSCVLIVKAHYALINR